MKTFKMNLFLVLILSGITAIAKGQGASDWSMVLNNNPSTLNIVMINHEFNFTFKTNDTLSFSMGKKKPIKSGFSVEVTLKNNGKVVYASSDKNMNSTKTEIVVPMIEVYNALKNMKLPSKPKYVLSIKDKNLVKEKILFDFAQ